ncbi:DNA ligase D [Christiangramia sabulilitoris]|uniref:DNA ligase (ATP) n=1 Tax=Christiangramia sabulilitoris TaxID=2583991 RepID=A0A550HZI6_9FLAO|nr:DNA ligase D [Christiangramia sabulilitoris]TRO64115.1 DNA ligase D [Christiangramia sabulilitoris]
MGLDEYIKKRNFSDTPEPGGDYDKSDKHRFVFQRHRASRLHYDLRLEMEGVLKSWAVPKGPSMNPGDKRLAVQTEDHPIKYLTFEGVIPKGNYGAGKMKIWDSGTFRSAISEKSLSQQYKEGNLKLLFRGEKVKGEFALLKTEREGQQNHWLLIKKKDTYSTDLLYDAEDYRGDITEENRIDPKVKKLDPRAVIKPMLATTAKKIFNHPDWIYELKWDGYRMIAHIENSKVSLTSRNGISYDSRFPDLVRDLQSIPHEVILDGEVVALNEKGLPAFQELQNYSESSGYELKYYVFDMLYLNGHSMLDLPLLDRKSLIPEILQDTSLSLYCDHIETMGTAFYEKAIEAGMEGIIAKKASSTYVPGYRSENWLKVKAFESQEALICGYTESKGALFGSLILGMYKNGKLEYIGNVGTGFSAKDQKDILEKLQSSKTGRSPFEEKINLKGRIAHWVNPQLICEVRFSEWTRTGKMRHPIFKGLREDKEITEVTKENQADQTQDTPVSISSNSLEIGGRKVNITNLEKIYWPDSGLRKYDLIDYYLHVSDYILPYLIDRPQNLHRHPNGINKPGFYQKDNEGLLAKWLNTFKIYSASSKRDIDYLLCQDEASLLYMANLGCIELNPWNSKINELDSPDYAVIDLDPSPKNTFKQVIEVAQVSKEILDAADIPAFCKTSGSSGLHIYIPLNAKYSYDEARDFIKLLCYFINERTRDLTTMERALKKRNGKIYLDYLQNRRGQTLASAYCVRPRPGAPVSAPIQWDELNTDLRIKDFNIQNMPARLQDKGDLFQGVLSGNIDMEAALERLNRL